MKLDWKPRDKDYVSFRYSHGRQDNPGINSFPLFYNSFNRSPFQNGVINWTRTFSPPMVNEARVGVNNVMLDNGGADKGLGNIAAQRRHRRRGTRPVESARFRLHERHRQREYRHPAVVRQYHVPLRRQPHPDSRTAHDEVRAAKCCASGSTSSTPATTAAAAISLSMAASPAQNAINPRPLFGEADFMLGLPDDIGTRSASRHLGPALHHLGNLFSG